jgi:bifunctional DNA-binding transcriptional regulator/antitoxin component of YhaV-PrlF toxin-antitoxin module
MLAMDTTNTVNLRDRRQITLPADIVAAAGLKTDDQLQVSWRNGAIVLVPTRAGQAAVPSMRRFLGVAKGVYGSSSADVDQRLREERAQW